MYSTMLLCSLLEPTVDTSVLFNVNKFTDIVYLLMISVLFFEKFRKVFFFVFSIEWKWDTHSLLQFKFSKSLL